LFTLFATFITFGIYPVYWFFNRAKQLNQLRSEKKITWEPAGYLIAGIVYLVFGAVAALQDNTIMALLAVAAWLFIWFAYLRMIYRMRAILNDHFGEKRVGPILTFIFNIYYLQYHINRLIKSEMIAKAPLAS